jgi:hypothetical protein
VHTVVEGTQLVGVPCPCAVGGACDGEREDSVEGGNAEGDSAVADAWVALEATEVQHQDTSGDWDMVVEHLKIRGVHTWIAHTFDKPLHSICG